VEKPKPISSSAVQQCRAGKRNAPSGSKPAAPSTTLSGRCSRARSQPEELSAAWTRSAAQVLTAFDNTELGREVRLAEINPDGTFPAAAVVGMHHTWDIATSLGQPYRPDDEIVDIVATQARRVPAGTTRTRPRAAFAPVIATNQADPWLTALALLGRSKLD